MDNKTRQNLYLVCIVLICSLAFLLRIKTYLLARPLWHDECSLATNILARDFGGFFQPLDNGQKAPAIFMILNKIVSLFGGISELSLKFVPMLSGLFSVIAFYFLSKEMLKNKFSIIVANFLFAINYQLIYWAQKFKQYSFDVLLFMISILFFTKLDLNKISYKKTFLLSFIGILMVLASFPCAFVLGAYILFCIIKRINFKKIILFCFPLISFCLFYYLIYLQADNKVWMTEYFKYWGSGFLNLGLNNFFTIVRENFNFFFIPNYYTLIGLLLFVFGLILYLKERNKTSDIILLSFLGIIVASALQIYPIWQRAALYLLPIVLLFITKPLDLLSKNKKILNSIIIILFWAYFSKYNIFYVNNFLNQNAFAFTDAITVFPKLVERYSNNDILVINSTTKADFIYYSKIYKFNPQNIILVPINTYDKEYYYNFMNTLQKGHTYWFVFGWEYSHKLDDLENSISNHLNNYINDHHLKVVEKYEDNNSILIKVKI